MLLDYKSMYSYSLGVLYGCRCLGFDPVAIWKLNPEYWYIYNGQKATYFNLVSTAWQTFRFHYTSFIEDIDDNPDHPEWADKYKGITLNRLWNYGDTPDIDKSNSLPYMTDEKLYYLAAVKPTYESVSWDSAPSTLTNESNYVEPIIYSRNGDSSTQILDVRYFDETTEFIIDGVPVPYRVISFIAIGYNIKSYNEYKWKIRFSIIEQITIDDVTTDVENQYEYNITVNGNLLYLDPRSTDNSIISMTDKIKSAIDNSRSITVEIRDSEDTQLYLSTVQPIDDNNIYVGKYLNVDQSTLDMSWEDISDKVPSISVDSSQLDTGLLADVLQPIIRYIATTPVKIYKAYQWQSEVTDTSVSSRPLREQPPKYLSPSTGDYYVATGCLGWVNFNEDIWRNDTIHDNKLTFGPTSYNALPSSSIKLCRDKRDNTVSSYYKCYVSSNKSGTEDDYLYGIFNRVITRDTDSGSYVFPNGTSFKSIISDDLFNSCYDTYEIVSGYTLETWYNIDEPVDILVENNTRHKYMWDGDDINGINPEDSTPILISYYGYTPKQATRLNAFDIDSNNNLVEVDLRYYRSSENPDFADSPYGYWSSTWAQPAGRVDFYFTNRGKGETNNTALIQENTLYSYKNTMLSYNDYNDYNGKQPISYTIKKLIKEDVYKYTTIEPTINKDEFIATNGNPCKLTCLPGTEDSPLTSVGKEVWSVQFESKEYFNRPGYESNPQNWRQSHDFFIKISKTSLYMGTRKLADDIDVYEKDGVQSIYTTNDDNIPETGMITMDYLRSTYGITPYLCPVILQDDDGRYLTDDGTATGTPLVWYDQHVDTNPYWNGVYGVNRWQDYKPKMLNGKMYDMSTHSEVPVFDNETL